jgi:hypothetical protein
LLFAFAQVRIVAMLALTNSGPWPFSAAKANRSGLGCQSSGSVLPRFWRGVGV